MQNVFQLTLAKRLYLIIFGLGVLGALSTAIAVWNAAMSKASFMAQERALRGSLHLERINGFVYVVVMDSRGIYMSPDWKTSEPYGRGMLKALEALETEVIAWQKDPIESERARIQELRGAIAEFVRFRSELVRLAREETTVKARAFGDNDANRRNRQDLNAKINDLAKAYLAHSTTAAEAVTRAETVGGWTHILLTVFGVLALIVGLVVVRKALVAPLDAMTVAMRTLAMGQTEIAISGAERKDEMGELARALEVFRANAVQRAALEDNARREVARREAQAQELDQLIRSFQETVRNVMSAVHSETTGMLNTAETLLDVAGQTANCAENVSSATSSAKDSVNIVAAAAEELEASIREISAQAQNAHAVAVQASTEAAEANKRVGGLSHATAQIGSIVSMISAIAEQTNLLALNATIEAARAGDAGRGFAIVAQEVKNLSAQTAKATEDISERIRAVQLEATEAVTGIGKIVATIGHIESAITTVASAVEEQGSATRQIAENIVLAAGKTEEVARGIGSVSANASDTNSAAAGVEKSAKATTTATEHLTQAIDGFLGRVGSERNAERATPRAA